MHLPMKTVIASVGKNVLLFILLILSAVNIFLGFFPFKTLISIQVVSGLAYIFLSSYEYLNASYKASLPLKRFPYAAYSTIMFKVLKTSIFLTLTLVLYFSEDRFKMLYPICLIIAITEGSITALRYWNDMFFVNIYANYILLVEDKIQKVFASEILLVEFRHDIFYIVKKDHKTISLKLEYIAENNLFTKNLYEWVKRNNISLSEESAKKIQAKVA